MWRLAYYIKKHQNFFHLGWLIFKWKTLNLSAKWHKLIANAPFRKESKENLWRTKYIFLPPIFCSSHPIRSHWTKWGENDTQCLWRESWEGDGGLGETVDVSVDGGKTGGDWKWQKFLQKEIKITEVHTRASVTAKEGTGGVAKRISWKQSSGPGERATPGGRTPDKGNPTAPTVLMNKWQDAKSKPGTMRHWGLCFVFHTQGRRDI